MILPSSSRLLITYLAGRARRRVNSIYFQRINRDDPERVFINVQNVYSTAALAAGDAVCFDVATFDGVRVTNPLTANLNLPAGVAAEAIAVNGFGLVQAYGFRDDVDVDGTTGLGAGDALLIANASFDLILDAAEVTGAKGAFAPCFVAGEAYTTGAAADKAVFIRCL